MLLKIDAAQLEWRVKVFLAQDQVGVREILDNQDIHTNNINALGLPDRNTAKIFVYRWIFSDAFGDTGVSGPAYAYANDALFQKVSTSVKFWERVIQNGFDKYKGIYEHSVNLIREATTTGRIVDPSGRYYPFTTILKRGTLDWPRASILNYPIQGFSAFLMSLGRLLVAKFLRELGEESRVLLMNTVHDDVELDVDNDPNLLYNICIGLEHCFSQIPAEFERRYGKPINVPMAGEVKFGMSLNEQSMKKFKKESFFKDYEEYLINHGKIQH